MDTFTKPVTRCWSSGSGFSFWSVPKKLEGPVAPETWLRPVAKKTFTSALFAGTVVPGGVALGGGEGRWSHGPSAIVGGSSSGGGVGFGSGFFSVGGAIDFGRIRVIVG